MWQRSLVSGELVNSKCRSLSGGVVGDFRRQHQAWLEQAPQRFTQLQADAAEWGLRAQVRQGLGAKNSKQP